MHDIMRLQELTVRFHILSFKIVIINSQPTASLGQYLLRTFTALLLLTLFSDSASDLHAILRFKRTHIERMHMKACSQAL